MYTKQILETGLLLKFKEMALFNGEIFQNLSPK